MFNLSHKHGVALLDQIDLLQEGGNLHIIISDRERLVGIQLLQFLQRILGNIPAAVGGTLQRAVMKNNQVAVLAQINVIFNKIRTIIQRQLIAFDGVLRRQRRQTAVADDIRLADQGGAMGIHLVRLISLLR
ncbi:hypothetical protein D3C75_813000 [compost metagenome]